MRPALLLALALAACGQPAPPAAPGAGAPAAAGGAAAPAPAPLPPQPDRDVSTPPKLAYVTQGTGDLLQRGDVVLVHYDMTAVATGKKVDSSRDRGAPFPARVGAGHVFEGWDLVLLKLRVGDRVKTTIPSDLAYGDRGYNPFITGRTDILLDLEVLSRLAPPTWDVLATGTGEQIRPGMIAKLHAVGALPGGKEFVNTRTGGEPLVVQVGTGDVVEALDLVLPTMRVGDRRKVHVPWVYGHGPDGSPDGSVPPMTNVTFDVEVLSAEAPK